jgi:hypothetical protein
MWGVPVQQATTLLSHNSHVIYRPTRTETCTSLYISNVLFGIPHTSLALVVIDYRYKHAVTYLVEELRYKPEGRGSDS